ncbi:SPOR domain-containing protein [Niveibacterium sp.]|uniref:SPOR domain-containing protein n=1 Tax=Niveibacterium sp. TaxID=2017444 RepID=UPI0035B35B76
MAETDTQLELKKRARRRLVGAGALALLAAIVLPLVMEHEPKQAGQDIQIRIPSQEGANFASRVIQGAAPAPTKPAVPVEDDKIPSSTNVPSPSEGATASAPAPKAPEPAPAQSAPKPQTPEEPHVAKMEKPASTKPVESSAKKSESERAAAILSGEKATTAEAGSGYVVQLGAFKDASNISAVRSKVKAQGYSSYTEVLGDKTRVRAGPFATRDAADAAAAKLRKAGLAGVVTPRS